MKSLGCLGKGMENSVVKIPKIVIFTVLLSEDHLIQVVICLQINCIVHFSYPGKCLNCEVAYISTILSTYMPIYGSLVKLEKIYGESQRGEDDKYGIVLWH